MRPSLLQTSATISTDALTDLHQRTSGTLHTPQSPGWDGARMPWLVNVDQHPLAVLEVADLDDVVAAVRWALANGVQVAAQPFGHGAGHDLRGALLLRTGALGGIEIDVARHTARVGAGVSGGQLTAALAGTGLAFLVGSNPHPSVVGMTLTGGLSWFGRAFGLGCESIVSAEVVDGTGRVRQVNAHDDPELFWGLRGGGGDLAIVTAIEVALHPAPTIYGGSLFWPIESMAEVLAGFRTLCEGAPEKLTSWYHTLQFPPFPDIPEPFRGRSFASVAFTFLGDAAAGEALIAPLRAIPGVVLDFVGEVPIEAVPALAGEPTDPMPGQLRSTLIERIDDQVIEGLLAAVGPGTRSPLMIVQIRQLGGALGRTAPDAGCHGPIAEGYNLQAIGVPATPELAMLIGAACDQVVSAVAHVSTGRTLMNFLNHDETNTWWDPATRARLVRIKESVDPVDTIRSNRPVRD